MEAFKLQQRKILYTNLGRGAMSWSLLGLLVQFQIKLLKASFIFTMQRNYGNIYKKDTPKEIISVFLIFCRKYTLPSKEKEVYKSFLMI